MPMRHHLDETASKTQLAWWVRRIRPRLGDRLSRYRNYRRTRGVCFASHRDAVYLFHDRVNRYSAGVLRTQCPLAKLTH
jgi:hypothetical protein